MSPCLFLTTQDGYASRQGTLLHMPRNACLDVIETPDDASSDAATLSTTDTLQETVATPTCARVAMARTRGFMTVSASLIDIINLHSDRSETLSPLVQPPRQIIDLCYFERPRAPSSMLSHLYPVPDAGLCTGRTTDCIYMRDMSANMSCSTITCHTRAGLTHPDLQDPASQGVAMHRITSSEASAAPA